MSQLYVDNIKGRTGGAVNTPSGIVCAGVGTFAGDVKIGGVLTYEDVTNIDAVGVITAQQGIRVGAGKSIGSDGAAVVYYGDGSNLDGVVSGVETKEATVSKGTSQTSLNFTGATLSVVGSETTIAISAGVDTSKTAPSANTVVSLNLNTAQHHEITLSAGITTISATGGVYGQSHSLVINQPSSGIATVGFGTMFLFPSGSTPAMSEGGSKIDLVSFVVKNVGGTGTELLASAGLDYSN